MFFETALAHGALTAADRQLMTAIWTEACQASADIAERTGYSSVNTFGVAFTRYVGMPPGRYARG